MKKFAFVVLSFVMLFCMVANASAGIVEQTPSVPTNFPMYVYCNSTTKYVQGSNWVCKYSGVNNHAIFVNHTVTGGSNEYTNHYRGCEVDEDGGFISNRGAKWCTTSLTVPIQNANIVNNGAHCYTVTARGNTNHYDYDGVSRVTLQTKMYVNYTEMP